MKVLLKKMKSEFLELHDRRIDGLPFILATPRNRLFRMRNRRRSNGVSNTGLFHDIG